MDYRQEGIKLAVATLETIVMTVTPNEIIEKVDELVHMAVDKDMTGMEKFMWVLQQAQPLVYKLFKGALMLLIQALYDKMMEMQGEPATGV